MYSTCKYIRVSWDYVDYHKWDDAPDEVAFLKNLHRHKFFASAMIEVHHDDRELEFFMVLRRIEQEIMPYMYLGTPLISTSEKVKKQEDRETYVISSCEQQAQFILDGLKSIYGQGRNYQIEVSEDNENSAIVTWQKL